MVGSSPPQGLWSGLCSWEGGVGNILESSATPILDAELMEGGGTAEKLLLDFGMKEAVDSSRLAGLLYSGGVGA